MRALRWKYDHLEKRRPLMRARILVTAIAAILFVGVASAPLATASSTGQTRQAQTATASAPPAGFVKHAESRYWTWYGPSNWVGAYGAYGITVSSPTGSWVRDYGASSTFCGNAPTWKGRAADHFAAKRTQVKGAAKTWKWTTIQPIKTIGTRNYSQANAFEVTIRGKQIRGKIIFTFADITGTGYCFESNDGRTAPKSQYTQAIKTLDAVAKYTYYYGPGI